MPFEPRANPPWSWSLSRRACFRECPRRYYWQYYGSFNGWQPDAPEPARLAYRLKHLESLSLLAGEVLHDLFAETLRAVRGGRAPPPADALFAEARHRMNRAYAERNGSALVRAARRARGTVRPAGRWRSKQSIALQALAASGRERKFPSSPPGTGTVSL